MNGPEGKQRSIIPLPNKEALGTSVCISACMPVCGKRERKMEIEMKTEGNRL